jgi:hypothetical protein
MLWQCGLSGLDFVLGALPWQKKNAKSVRIPPVAAQFQAKTNIAANIVKTLRI